MYFIAAVLEGLAAYLATENISKDCLNKMREIEVFLEDEECQRDYERWLKLNNEFHNVFISACKKTILINLLNQKTGPLGRYWYLGCTSPGMLDSCILAHREILEAFYRKDADAVRKAAEGHLFQVGRLMRKHLERFFVI